MKKAGEKVTNHRSRFTKLDSKNLSEFFSSNCFKQTETKKKIYPTTVKPSVREKFKKLFLPLLVEVFELRQALETYVGAKKSLEFSYFSDDTKPPSKVLEELTQLKKDIEESKRWCSGVLSQIDKAMDEAKAATDHTPSFRPKIDKRKNLFQKIFNRFRRKL